MKNLSLAMYKFKGVWRGFLRFQETPLKIAKTNKIMCFFKLDPGNKVKL